jgi:hypothetical protein
VSAQEAEGRQAQPQWVLRASSTPEVDWVEVDGEVVAWVRRTQDLHLLDHTAAMIFQLCDGVAPLSRTIQELADVFGLPGSAVSADVMSCATELYALGLVEIAR